MTHSAHLALTRIDQTTGTMEPATALEATPSSPVER